MKLGMVHQHLSHPFQSYWSCTRSPRSIPPSSKKHTSIPVSNYPALPHFSPNFPVAAKQATPSFQPPDTLSSHPPKPASHPSLDGYISSLHAEDTNPNALAFGPPTCWNCGSLDHVKKRCPHPLVDRRRLPYHGPQPLPQRAHHQHPLPQQGLLGFQSFYPIISPLHIGATYPTLSQTTQQNPWLAGELPAPIPPQAATSSRPLPSWILRWQYCHILHDII